MTNKKSTKRAELPATKVAGVLGVVLPKSNISLSPSGDFGIAEGTPASAGAVTAPFLPIGSPKLIYSCTGHPAVKTAGVHVGAGTKNSGSSTRRKQQPPPLVVAITGTPGTGKTTISDIVAEKLGFAHVDVSRLIKSDVKRYGLGWDEERKTIIANIPETRKKVQELVRENKEKNQGFVIDGHFSPEVCKPDLVIVLRCPPKKLYKRLRTRKNYAETSVKENVEAECIDSCFVHAQQSSGKAARIIEIETSGSVIEDSEKVVRAIKSARIMRASSRHAARKKEKNPHSKFDYSDECITA